MLSERLFSVTVRHLDVPEWRPRSRRQEVSRMYWYEAWSVGCGRATTVNDKTDVRGEVEVEVDVYPGGGQPTRGTGLPTWAPTRRGTRRNNKVSSGITFIFINTTVTATANPSFPHSRYAPKPFTPLSMSSRASSLPSSDRRRSGRGHVSVSSNLPSTDSH